jgi:FRG domain
MRLADQIGRRVLRAIIQLVSVRLCSQKVAAHERRELPPQVKRRRVCSFIGGRGGKRTSGPTTYGSKNLLYRDTTKTWTEFVQAVDPLGDSMGSNWITTSPLVFRGQADAHWDLSTSLERNRPPTSMSDAEAIFLAEFEKRERGFLEPYLLPSSQLERLAIMQHFGAPTRLLDVTRSPYIAAFFAAEAPPVGAGSFAVWTLNMRIMNSMLGRTIQGDERKKSREDYIRYLRALDGANYDPKRYLIENDLDRNLGTDLMAAIIRDFPRSNVTAGPVSSRTSQYV